MKELVRYAVTDGGSVLIEVDVPDAQQGIARAATRRDGVIVESGQRLEQAVDEVWPAAEAIVTKVRKLTESADSVAITFGLKLTVQAGAVIASGSAEGNFTISITWSGKDSG